MSELALSAQLSISLGLLTTVAMIFSIELPLGLSQRVCASPLTILIVGHVNSALLKTPDHLLLVRQRTRIVCYGESMSITEEITQNTGKSVNKERLFTEKITTGYVQ